MSLREKLIEAVGMILIAHDPGAWNPKMGSYTDYVDRNKRRLSVSALDAILDSLGENAEAWQRIPSLTDDDRITKYQIQELVAALRDTVAGPEEEPSG